MKLYIAGVISLGGTLSVNQQKRNVKLFYRAEEVLRKHGHEPVNPVRDHPVDPNTDWQTVMRADIKTLMDCDGVYALKGWANGKGSRIEVGLAAALGMPVIQEKELL